VEREEGVGGRSGRKKNFFEQRPRKGRRGGVGRLGRLEGLGQLRKKRTRLRRDKTKAALGGRTEGRRRGRRDVSRQERRRKRGERRKKRERRKNKNKTEGQTDTEITDEPQQTYYNTIQQEGRQWTLLDEDKSRYIQWQAIRASNWQRRHQAPKTKAVVDWPTRGCESRSEVGERRRE